VLPTTGLSVAAVPGAVNEKSGNTLERFSNFDPTSINQLREVFALLRKPVSTEALKKYGQNFLIDGQAGDSIITAAQLSPADTVLEIGPGSGVLTQKMAPLAHRIVAIDIDPYLLEVTRLAVGKASNVELRLEDVRKINLPKLFCAEKSSGSYIVVSNLPYYLTGYLLELFSTSPCSPRRMVLTLQKEVAERILAPVGDHTMLSISMAVFGKTKLVREIPAESFWPQPLVDSAVIRIDRHERPVIAPADQKKFFRVVKAGFSARRKKLSNALSGGLRISIDEAKKLLTAAGLPENARAQELSLENWSQLSQKVGDSV
jgi:16S rRNA (adenine1518-N6/adenine1519-N6)-dimethyltransferase